MTATFPRVCIKSSSVPLPPPLDAGGRLGGADIFAFLFTVSAAASGSGLVTFSGGGAVVCGVLA